jgi:hypothetical protein
MQDYASHSEKKKKKEIGKMSFLLLLLLFSSPNQRSGARARVVVAFA